MLAVELTTVVPTKTELSGEALNRNLDDSSYMLGITSVIVRSAFAVAKVAAYVPHIHKKAGDLR